MTTSLFAHLIGRFPTPPEVLTTEALAFVLSRSPLAASAMLNYARASGAPLSGDYTFRSEEGEQDSGRPDLVGRDANGHVLLLIEAKFWAPLTPKQPKAYLQRLRDEVKRAQTTDPSAMGLLLFLAPDKRSALLWSALCDRAGSPTVSTREVGPMKTLHVDEHVAMSLTTWHDVLAALRSAPGVSADASIDADLRQIEGLVQRQDSQAFLPLSLEELEAPLIPRRWRDFDGLIDAACDELLAGGVISRKGLSTGKDRNGWGKYIRIDGTNVLFAKNARLWERVAPTPLWLRFWGTRGAVPARRARAALGDWAHATPRRLYTWYDHAVVPLYVPVGLEKDAVTRSISDAITEVATRLIATPVSSLPTAPTAPTHDEAPDEEADDEA